MPLAVLAPLPVHGGLPSVLPYLLPAVGEPVPVRVVPPVLHKLHVLPVGCGTYVDHVGLKVGLVLWKLYVIAVAAASVPHGVQASLHERLSFCIMCALAVPLWRRSLHCRRWYVPVCKHVLQVVHHQLLVLALVVYPHLQEARRVRRGAALVTAVSGPASACRPVYGIPVFRDKPLDLAAHPLKVLEHLPCCGPRYGPPAPLVVRGPELLVVRVEVCRYLALLESVLFVNLAHYGLVYPADVSDVPFCRACKDRRLDCKVVRLQRAYDIPRPGSCLFEKGNQPARL